MNESEALRLVAVRGNEGIKQSFLLNRYQELRFQSGDTILADTTVDLSPSERELVSHVKDLELAVDGSPEDMLATLLAKVFQAGLDAASR